MKLKKSKDKIYGSESLAVFVAVRPYIGISLHVNINMARDNMKAKHLGLGCVNIRSDF